MEETMVRVKYKKISKRKPTSRRALMPAAVGLREAWSVACRESTDTTVRFYEDLGRSVISIAPTPGTAKTRS